ncbi:MAG TPA: ATP-binding protein, partial [Polyangiaceae bacterium]|nr:ATP-binding protein [Polyangiaceae bacterium]
DFVCTTDMTGAIEYLNRAAREFIGIAPDQELGNLNMSEVHPPAQADLLLNVAIPTAIRDGMWRGETEFVRHDRKVVTMLEVLVGHRDADGKVTHLSSIAKDMSRERELEEQFRQAHKMEAVGRLASGIAHDFNNLLAAIMGSTCLAADLLTPDHPARKELDEVNRASERAASLTGQLLAFCRKQVFQLRILDINATLLELEPLIQRLLGKNIQLTLAVGHEPAHIKADPGQIQQVLLNLVINARDAMPDGGKLRIEARKVMLDDGGLSAQLDLAPGRYVIVLVSDTGHGMTPEISRRIFEPFFTTKGPGHGTGLGLSTVFGVVKQTGGSVRVDTVQGRGSSFEIYLPCTAAPMDKTDANASDVQSAVGGVVLIAEDDEQLRNLIVRSLQRGGYEVLSADTAPAAAELATKLDRPIDLLLVDVAMPEMSGRELAARLRRDAPALRTLYMSGCNEDALVQHELLDPRVSFIPKPFPPGRLLIAVAELLSRPLNALAPAITDRSAPRTSR